MTFPWRGVGFQMKNVVAAPPSRDSGVLGTKEHEMANFADTFVPATRVIDVLLENRNYPMDWERAVEVAELHRMIPFEELWRFDLGECAHGYDVRTLIENEDLRWFLNSYVVPPNLRTNEAVFILGGFHDLHDRPYPYSATPRPDFIYCIPWAWSPLGILYRW